MLSNPSLHIITRGARCVKQGERDFFLMMDGLCILEKRSFQGSHIASQITFLESLGLARASLGEDDGDFLKMKTMPISTICHLYLESVAVGADGIQVDGF
ncbi:MAG: hypothetical protein KatS3mg022_2244 [Armatimonadota bacterium]|nr:MAG: hypothetical protein KatS3mg022_2244 [Armatimonadota bacterium]